MNPSLLPDSHQSSPSKVEVPQKSDRNRHVQTAALMLVIVLVTTMSGLAILALAPSSAVAAIIFVVLVCTAIETVIALLLLIKSANHALQLAYEAEEVVRLLRQLAERE